MLVHYGTGACMQRIVSQTRTRITRSDNLVSPLESFDHLLALLATVLCELALLQELVQNLSLVKLLKQLALKLLLGVVDQVEHDGLGHSVNDGTLDNVEVRGDQQLCSSQKKVKRSVIA